MLVHVWLVLSLTNIGVLFIYKKHRHIHSDLPEQKSILNHHNNDMLSQEPTFETRCTLFMSVTDDQDVFKPVYLCTLHLCFMKSTKDLWAWCDVCSHSNSMKKQSTQFLWWPAKRKRLKLPSVIFRSPLNCLWNGSDSNLYWCADGSQARSRLKCRILNTAAKKPKQRETRTRWKWLI